MIIMFDDQDCWSTIMMMNNNDDDEQRWSTMMMMNNNDGDEQQWWWTTMMMMTMINITCLYAYVNIIANLNESDATPKLTFEVDTAALDGI